MLNIVYETMPRDNLLNSACLELFEFIKREGVKQIIVHLVETYKERLLGITYVNTFHSLVLKYDQMQNGYVPTEENSFSTQGADTPNRGVVNGGQRWQGQGLKDTDAEEEAYFNTSDGEDEEEASLPTTATVKNLVNGNSPARSLVAYPDDDDDVIDTLQASPNTPQPSQPDNQVPSPTGTDGELSRGRDRTPVPISEVPSSRSPPERPSEKRRREDDEEDDLDKIATGTAASKRRNSNASSTKPDTSNGNTTPTRENGPSLRRKGSLRSGSNISATKLGVSPGAISISLKPSPGAGGENDGAR